MVTTLINRTRRIVFFQTPGPQTLVSTVRLKADMKDELLRTRLYSVSTRPKSGCPARDA